MNTLLKDSIVLDVETSKLPNIMPWHKGSFLSVVGIKKLGTGEKKFWVFNHKERDPSVRDIDNIAEITATIREANRIIGHNIKFDVHWLDKLNVYTTDKKIFCTMIADYLINGQRSIGYTLGECCERINLPGKTDQVKEYWKNGIETNKIPLDTLIEYLGNDLDITGNLVEEQFNKILKWKLGKVVYIQMELCRILQEIERNGMKVDPTVAEKYMEQFSKELTDIDKELILLFGFDVNLNSNDELSAGLYGGTFKREGTEWVIRELKCESKYYERKCKVEIAVKGLGFKKAKETKKEGVYKTDKNTLKFLNAKNKKQKRVLELLLNRSKVGKALETFQGKDDTKGLVNKIQSDGLIHSNYNQAVTKTGRLSSSDPNSQNLPRGKTSPIKEMFIPRNDWIVNADLSQLEWRGGAFLSQDPVMIKEILEGKDVHSDNAIGFFGDLEYRTTAKIMTFRLLYGGSAYGFYMDQEMPNFPLPKWKEIVDAFNTKYSGLCQWQDKNITFVHNNGYLQNPTGRLFVFDKITFRDGSIGFSVRQIKNYPVQSISTADITPMVMLEIRKHMYIKNIKSLMIGQVHDSILFDAYHDEVEKLSKICLSVMNNVPSLMMHYYNVNWNIPMGGEVEVGKSYGNLMSLEDWRKQYVCVL